MVYQFQRCTLYRCPGCFDSLENNNRASNEEPHVKYCKCSFFFPKKIRKKERKGLATRVGKLSSSKSLLTCSFKTCLSHRDRQGLERFLDAQLLFRFTKRKTTHLVSCPENVHALSRALANINQPPNLPTNHRRHAPPHRPQPTALRHAHRSYPRSIVRQVTIAIYNSL